MKENNPRPVVPANRRCDGSRETEPEAAANENAAKENQSCIDCHKAIRPPATG